MTQNLVQHSFFCVSGRFLALLTLTGCAEIDVSLENETDTQIIDDIVPDTETSDSDAPGSDSDDTSKPDGEDSNSSSDSEIPSTGIICTFETAVKKCGAVDLCVDGFCCDTPCNRPCESCAVSGHEGTCTLFDANEDPENECGTCRVCNGLDDAPACVGVGYGEELKQECGPCRFCNGEDILAACVPVPVNSDPFDDCEADETASCGRTGWCDGMGFCELYGDDTPCAPMVCSDLELVSRQYAYRCDGRGACQEMQQMCGGYTCDITTSRCRRACEFDTDCLEGFSCISRLCAIDIPKQYGASCLNDDECASKHCVDDICCDTACDGNCEACDLTQSIGFCSPIPLNTDPDDDCPTCFVCGNDQTCVLVAEGEEMAEECLEDSDPLGCGLSGQCDGSGGCAFRNSDHLCSESSCAEVGGRATVTAHLCDGRGICSLVSSHCGTFTCEDDEHCNQTCENDDGCAADAVCFEELCVAQHPVGTSCNFEFECKSGRCVDGYCCDSECDGACVRCDNPESPGICGVAPDNTDFDDDCPVCEVCVGGACVAVVEGEDPADDCSEGRPKECGYTGVCDGDGACALRGETYPCGSTCVGEAHLPLFCDGEHIGRAGCTIQGKKIACDDNLLCDPWIDACPAACISIVDCVAGTYCNEEGKCTPQKENAALCESDAMCISGFCTDGVCCDAACDGDCRGCNLPGKEGTCRNHPVGSDPDDECPVCWGCDDTQTCAPLTDVSAPAGDCLTEELCGHTGQCIDGACEFRPAGESCGDLICAGADNAPNVTRFECDGEGTCLKISDQTCGGYRCASESECLDECTDGSDCAVSYNCNDNKCTSDNPNGTPCMLDSECKSRNCVDGVCCNTPCNDLCEACDIEDAVGTCTPEPDGEWGTSIATGDADCGACEVCNGSGECRPVDITVNPDDPADPRNICGDPSAPEACGLSGVCENGTGKCAYYLPDQLCDESCPYPGNTHYQWHCDGKGHCVIDEEGEVCPNSFACLEIESGCRTSCRNQSHCDALSYCQDDECIPKKESGEPCDSTFECLSGLCPEDDGVCCNNACTGTCESCSLVHNLGICLPIPAGEDPDDECDDGKFCTQNDHCDGKGACVFEGTPCNETDLNICNDCNEIADHCIQPSGTQCGNPLEDDCTAPDTCNSSGECIPNHLPDETPCTPDTNDCTYDICDNGVCSHPDSGNSDEDSFCDAMDNCPEETNENQTDSDKDGTGDACDECPSDPFKTRGPCLKAEIYTERYDNMIIVHFEIANHGTLPVSPDNLTMRYWYTVDNMFNYQQIHCFWVDAGPAFPKQCDNIVMWPESAVFHPVARKNANYYVQIAFQGTIDDIPASSGGVPGRSGTMQLAWNTDPFSNFIASNDYSYEATTTMIETEKTTIYDNGILVWGIEPSQ